MFITFEGIDASGKTSAICALKEHISKKYNIDNFVFTREPGGKDLKVAEEIRELILDNKNDIDPFTEALLYLASRKIHVEKIIKPSLKNNKIVICDRYIDSSIVYQGNARNIGMDKIEKLNLMVIDNLLPKYTFYFKIDAQTSFERLKEQNREFDRLEKEGKNFFEKVIEGYEFLVKRDNKRFIVIDAKQKKEDVVDDLLKWFDKIINNEI